LGWNSFGEKPNASLPVNSKGKVAFGESDRSQKKESPAARIRAAGLD